MKTISFANQKGGSGKTNTTRAVATWLHNNSNLKVMVIDLDFQQTCTNERAKDVRAFEELKIQNPKQQKVVFFEEMQKEKGIYPIYGIPNIKDNLSQFLEIYKRGEEEFDLCFIDVPGNIESTTVDEILGYINYMFIPTDVDFGSIQSSITFGHAIMTLAESGRLPDLYRTAYYFNKYSLAKNKTLFPEIAEKMTEVTNIPFLVNNIKETNDMKMDNTTIWPMKGSTSPEHFLYKFCMELILNLK